MAGIYIHIPFCKKRCRYCDFFKNTDLSSKIQLLSAFQNELQQRNNELEEEIVQTIYIGGGTPSLLTPYEITELLNKIHQCYNVDPSAEITFECNPDDLNPEYLAAIKTIGINRLSIGIQSFLDTDLELMDRRHRAGQAIQAVKDAQKVGFNNISIDLIYGLPGQDLDAWKHNIKQAVDLDIQHISAYHLTYHEGTVFYRWLNDSKLKELPDNLSLQQFEILKRELEKAGFEQYEISNFAKNRLYSKHNSAYWRQQKYLGIGPSAHSFDLKIRRWNVSNIQEYIKGIETKTVCWEQETLTESDRYNDYIITRLRTVWGISISEIENTYSPSFARHFTETVKKYLLTGHVKQTGDLFTLTTEGLFISDRLMEDLIYINEK